MKNLILILAVLLTFSSCTKCKEGHDDFDKVFTHEIPNCDDKENLENNCKESINFYGKTYASLLIGGSDIIENVTYTMKDKIIEIDHSLEISFEIISDNELKRIEDNSIWERN